MAVREYLATPQALQGPIPEFLALRVLPQVMASMALEHPAEQVRQFTGRPVPRMGLMAFTGMPVHTTALQAWVMGETNASSGKGVYGKASSTAVTNYGVYGETASSSGFSGYFTGGKFHVYGNVGIGTTSPSQMLDVIGNGRFRSIGSGAYSGPVNKTSDGTLTTSTSDGRLKENVQTLQNSLEKVMKLRGVSFTWIKDPSMGTRIGFIAQEFEKVIPELVFTNETDGYKGINYAEVSAVLAEAVKELNAKVDRLAAENNRLKTEQETTEARLNKLESLVDLSAGK